MLVCARVPSNALPPYGRSNSEKKKKKQKTQTQHISALFVHVCPLSIFVYSQGSMRRLCRITSSLARLHGRTHTTQLAVRDMRRILPAQQSRTVKLCRRWIRHTCPRELCQTTPKTTQALLKFHFHSSGIPKKCQSRGP